MQRPPQRGWLWPLLTVLAALGYFVGMGVFGSAARAAILGFACDVTMCWAALERSAGITVGA